MDLKTIKNIETIAKELENIRKLLEKVIK